MALLRSASLVALVAAAVGCRPGTTTVPAPAESPPGPPWFEDVTAARGISFRHDPGPVGKYEMPQIMGSGAALVDLDGDGRLDVYLIHNAGPNGPTNRLYLQNPDGTFRDASAGSGLDVAGFGMGVAVGDVNNDGRPDVVLTEFGRTRLFLNLGGGRFKEVTREAGLDNPLWGTAIGLIDFDRDGWLDLVIVNYVAYDRSIKCGSVSGDIDYCNPAMYKGTVTRLYRNLGRQPDGSVKFADVTVAAGLAAGTGNGLGVVCADLTGDGWPDIFVANDGQPNRLWVNQHDGTFKDEAAVRGVAMTGTGSPAANMGIACGDVDGDGLLDLFVTHLGDETHTLWRQYRPGFFRDETATLGLTGGKWRGTGFGTALADFDRDGWPDLVLANGRVSKRRGSPRDLSQERFWEPYQDRHQLFAGVGGGKFRDLSEASPALCGPAVVGRALAVGDFDNDGAPDLLVTEIAGPARLLKNVASTAGHWLGVRAIDPAIHRDSIGSLVTVRAGGRDRVGLVNPAGSYLAASDPRVHFGLGSAETVESITVTWWDGSTERFACPGVDRYVELKKGQGDPAREGGR
jgi:enediyne biosynthesis protein E4